MSLCTTTHPLYTRFTKIMGTSISEATMRPNPTRQSRSSRAVCARTWPCSRRPRRCTKPHCYRGTWLEKNLVTGELGFSIRFSSRTPCTRAISDSATLEIPRIVYVIQSRGGHPDSKIRVQATLLESPVGAARPASSCRRGRARRPARAAGSPFAPRAAARLRWRWRRGAPRPGREVCFYASFLAQTK